MSTENKSHAIPRSIPVKTLSVFILIALLSLVIGVYFAQPIQSAVSKLTPDQHASDDGHDHASHAQYYTCGMHPWIILPMPGLCPICSMDLVPVDPAKFTGEIAIDPVVVQNMGVRTEKVSTGPLTKTIRTVGTVEYNETYVRDINIKISGWIEKLYVDYLGAKVMEGEPLMAIYSPDLYAAQQDYLIAYRAQAQQTNTPNISLLESARTRLRYYDITDEQIDQLQKENQPSKTMTLRSPYTGVVTIKNANEGMKVDPGMQVLRIADLSKVWIIVTLYEYQLPYIQVGNKATMSLPYIPGHTFEGSVVYIYPFLDKKTREVQVRLEFDNPDGLLKPGMFAHVTLENQLANDRTLVSREAIIDTGERQVAFVALGKGRFEPRDIVTGIQTENDKIEVLQGLKAGETVVTSGQFLLDSEAKIRAALARMIQGDDGNKTKPIADMPKTENKPQLPDAFADVLIQVIKPYLMIGKQLASDSMEHVAHHASTLSHAITKLTEQTLPNNEHFWHQHMQFKDALQASQTLSSTADIKQARQQYALISINLQQLLLDTGIPASFGQTIDALHCPMFRNDQGGSHWLQLQGDVKNPYFGSSMLECFDTQKTLPVAGKQAHEPADDNTAKLSDNPVDLMNQLIDHYLTMQHKLTLDQMDKMTEQIKQFQKIARHLATKTPEKQAKNIESVIKSSDLDTRDIKAFRNGFAQLSDTMISLIQATEPNYKLDHDVYQAYCPMVKKNWLQSEKDVRNPYAPYMLECGSIKAQLIKSTGSEK
jgi:RND family efflux transporter MFP subunit